MCASNMCCRWCGDSREYGTVIVTVANGGGSVNTSAEVYLKAILDVGY